MQELRAEQVRVITSFLSIVILGSRTPDHLASFLTNEVCPTQLSLKRPSPLRMGAR